MTRTEPFRVGDWLAEPELDRISHGTERVQLRSQLMEMLVYLAGRQGQVVSAEDLLNALWAGKVVTTGAVYNSVAELRQSLASRGGGSPYIETVPKRGYRLVAPVSALETPSAATQGRRSRRWLAAAAAAALLTVASVVAVLLSPRSDPTATGEKPPTVAVMQFSDVSAAGENAEFLAFGVHDDLLTMLSGFDEIRVISRTSIERFQRAAFDSREVGSILSARYILRGGVQRAGDRIRINVQLIDSSTDEHLWGQSYDRALTTENVFAIQREIAAAIVDALHVILTVSDRDRLSQLPTSDMAAYRAYLLGRQTMLSRTPQDLRRARRYFAEAIALDPDFALAYAGAADAAALLAAFTLFDEPHDIAELHSESEAAARQALQLNGELGEAYAAMGYVNWQRREFEEGEENFLRAIELSPNYADAYRWYAHLLWDTGRLDQSLDTMLQGISLDPLSPVMHAVLGLVYGAKGRLDDALATFDRALEIDPQLGITLLGRGELHLAYGEPAESIFWLRRLLSVELPSASSSPPQLPSATQRVAAEAELSMAYRHVGEMDQAAFWHARTVRSATAHFASRVRILDLQANDRLGEAAAVARERLLADPHCDLCLAAIGDHLVRSGQPEALLELVRDRFPDMPESASLRSRPLYRAGWIRRTAWALIETGDTARAEALITVGLDETQGHPRVATYQFGTGIEDAALHALLGRKDDALMALQLAVDEGWRYCDDFCGLDPLADPAFDAIRVEPEFLAIQADLAAALEAQRQRLLDMERNGELPPLPR